MDSSNCIFPTSVFHIIRQFVGPSKLASIMKSGVRKDFERLTYGVGFSVEINPETFKVKKILREDVEWWDDENLQHLPVCECLLNKIVAVGEVNVRIQYCEMFKHPLLCRGFRGVWTLWDLIQFVCKSKEYGPRLPISPLINNPYYSDKYYYWHCDRVFCLGLDVGIEDGIVCIYTGWAG